MDINLNSYEDLYYYLENISDVKNIVQKSIKLKFKQFAKIVKKSNPNINRISKIKNKDIISYYGLKKLEDKKIRLNSLNNDINLVINNIKKRTQNIELNSLTFKELFGICKTALSPLTAKIKSEENRVSFLVLSIPICLLIILFTGLEITHFGNVNIVFNLFKNIFFILSVIAIVHDSLSILFTKGNIGKTYQKIKDSEEKVENKDVNISSLLYITIFSLFTLFFIINALYYEPISWIFENLSTATLLIGSFYLFLDTFEKIKNTPKLVIQLTKLLFSNNKEENNQDDNQIEEKPKDENKPTKPVNEKEPEIDISII